MIVKNEQKYLREVLTALRPIREELETELIIGDTGSTDDTVEIAKEFANKVIHIKWENDFAHARNKVLDYARGKWLMSLDGDEVLQDCSDIIRFFKSGEYKKYDCALLQFKNVVSRDGGVDRLLEINAPRFYKINKNTRWVGKIHESIEATSPLKYLKTEVLHYGYFFETEEVKLQKIERNLAPLLEAHKENPESTRTIMQIAPIYMAELKYNEALKYIDIALDFYKNNPEKKDIYFHAIKQHYCECHNALNNFDEVIKATSEYFKETPKPMDNAYYFKKLEASSLSGLKRFEEAIEANKQALKYWDLMESGKLNKTIWDYITKGVHHKEEILRSIVRDSLIIGNLEEALKWQPQLADYNESKKREIFKLFADSVIKSPPDKMGTLAKIYEFAAKQIGGGLGGAPPLGNKENTSDYDMAIRILESYIKEPVIKIEVSNYILRGNVAPETDYFRLHQIRNYYLDGIPETPPMLDYFLKSDKKYSQIYGDVIFAAMEYKQDFTKFLDNLIIVDDKTFIDSFVNSNDDVADVCIEYLKQYPLETTSNSTTVLKRLSDILHALVTMEQGKGLKNADSDYYALLELYTKTYHRYLKLYLGDTRYNESTISALQEKDRFTYFLGTAYEAKSNGDIIKYTSYLQKAQNVAPNMKSTIEQMLLFAKNEAPAKSASSPSDQLESEIAKLKSAIYALIYTGNNTKAAEVLDSYERMNPTDPDILVIRGMVGS